MYANIQYVVRGAIWYHVYNLTIVTNTYGGVLILVKLKAEACNFTKINTPPWAFEKVIYMVFLH